METIITGDFNLDLLPKENGSNTTRKLLDLLTTYQLHQIIDKPTRVTESTKTLLDLIICKISDSKTIASGVIDLGISDHNLVYISRKIAVPKGKPRIIETRQFDKFKVDKFQKDLRQAFLHFKDYTDPNIALRDWNKIFLQIADINAPPRLKKVKSDRQPWITDEIKKLSFHRDYLKKKAVKFNSSSFFNSYKRCKNQVTELIKNAKTQYFKTNLEKSKNSKESWDLINKLLNKKQKITTINALNVESKNITGDENISNAFNNFFVEIGPKLAASIPSSDIDPVEYVRPCHTEFNFAAITITELATTINQIQSNKAPGVDKISNKLIKAAGNAIHDSLLHIFNLILDTGIFPDDLKFTRVTPIHKEDDKSECGNYRPISVIPALAKILEKLICEQINKHINSNNVICEHQSGFRPGHSTETALLYCTNQWLSNMDKGLINGVLFLDLKKAFDTVDHSILLQKMEKYGIKGTAHKLIKSYLSNRKQVCVHNNTKSNQKTVLCGIPQGSNLGPLLFSIYINDLPNCLKHTQASMFADDTNLTCTGSSAQEIEDKLNSDLCNVNRWLRANKLTLNNKKTKFMLIASKGKLNQISNNLKILANNSLIEQVNQKEVLGITIDQELNWKEHIDAQCIKLSSAIALLRRAKAFVTQTELIRMYNSLVFPYFTYCSNVWYDRNNRANIEKMYKMQKRAARVITSSNYEIRSKSIFQSLKWIPIELTLQKRVILMTSKAIRRAAPGYINNMFRYCNNSIYQMRSNRRKLALNKPRRNFMKKSFSYRGAVAWNNLPDNLTDNHEHFSIDHFKTSLDNYFNDLNDVN